MDDTGITRFETLLWKRMVAFLFYHYFVLLLFYRSDRGSQSFTVETQQLRCLGTLILYLLIKALDYHFFKICRSTN